MSRKSETDEDNNVSVEGAKVEEVVTESVEPLDGAQDVEPDGYFSDDQEMTEIIRRQEDKDGLIVVGVGASAGGLEALQSMVSKIPESSGLCFIIAQHLSPSYRSMMVGLLEKDSTIPVVAAADGIVLQANRIYICPPNHNIELASGDVIRLTSYPDVRHTPRPSVDMLFESIAMVKGENAVGVILSGTGSDGARGIRTIKAEGGIGIVQDPSSAKYDGMPNAACNATRIDLIVSPDQVGPEVLELLAFPRVRSEDPDAIISREVYGSILRLLKVHCDVDFRLYKENTILRRIERRMATLKIKKAVDYLTHLQNHKEEINFLFNEMLIGVTSFFRDSRAFELLRSELETYIKNKEGNTLRIWSVGCSTGEEAYSIAMIVADILGDKFEEWKIQIFATDIDKRSIAFARNGVYPEVAAQNMPQKIRENYLTVKQDQFEVVKGIKSRVIFSLHDVNKDPPFLRLDFICCRNLMIYFTVELQRQLLPVFHYALKPKGLLMLGQSESIGVFQEQFRPISKTGKLYESVYVGKSIPPERHIRNVFHVEDIDQRSILPSAVVKSSSPSRSTDDLFPEVIASKLKELLYPNSIVINENQDIVYVQGDNPLLVRPEGKPTNNIFKNLNGRLAVDLRSALHELDNGKEVADTGYLSLDVSGEDHWVKLVLVKAILGGPLGALTIIYCSVESPRALPISAGEKSASSEAALLEQQRLLARTKEQLQNVIEQLEASNEEMQSMNEELQSSNEELQSSNEELETTNEELQSTNEELQTAYSELRVAYEDKEAQQKELLKLRSELEQANSLLEEAERIGRTGSWLWDIDSRKINWSRGCYRIFGLDEKVFHPSFEAFIGVAHPEDRNRLEQHLTDLLHNRARQPFIFRAQDSDRNTIVVSMEALVSFNDLKQATKVMGSITDVTERISYERDTVQQKDKIGFILNSNLNGIYIYDIQTEGVDYSNSRFLELLGYDIEASNEEVIGGEFLELFHPDDQEKVIALFERIKTSRPGETFSLEYSLKKADGDYLTVSANHTVFQINDSSGEAERILVNFFPGAK
ncbi:PAS domain-containing protein [Spongiibacter taiwanensis]|uniref:CheR family methyltransferase n=1 Tax=Spongiibacter taiwanensis TaxID=1748242 RepID=UPI0020363BFF|nr:CheR family methyltransferase [Spongiibacter taiwanensis]USA44475.1 PAS domain-containing protein [Spongiibacter taiwanensis]